MRAARRIGVSHLLRLLAGSIPQTLVSQPALPDARRTSRTSPIRFPRFAECEDGLRPDPEASRGYTVYGYVDDRTRFWAEIDVPALAQSDRLLAALLTLQPDGGSESIRVDA